MAKKKPVPKKTKVTFVEEEEDTPPIPEPIPTPEPEPEPEEVLDLGSYKAKPYGKMGAMKGKPSPRKGRKFPQKKYSKEDVAAALVALESNSGNMTKTAKETGVHLCNLVNWKRKYLGKDPEIIEKMGKKRSEMGELFEHLTRVYVARALDSEAVEATKGKDAVQAASMALDRLRLIRGEATNISEVRKEPTTDERISVITKVLSVIEQRRVGLVAEERTSALPGIPLGNESGETSTMETIRGETPGSSLP